MRALALAAALLLTGCPDGLEKQSQITKLRVLAVRAEPPELVLQPDAGLPRTTLTALAVEPSGAPIGMRFALCELLGGVPSAQLDCPGDAGFDLADAGPYSALLDLGDPRFLAFALAYDGGIPDAGGLLAGGVPLVVGFRATAPAFGNPDGGPPAQQGSLQILDGFSTVTVRTGAPARKNPALAGLRIQEELDGGQPGAAIDAPPDRPAQVAAGVTVRFLPVPAAKEDPSARYGYSFFATAGAISALRSTDTTATGQPAETWVEWTAPLLPQKVKVWVVVRDGRGGAGWIERSIAVH